MSRRIQFNKHAVPAAIAPQRRPRRAALFLLGLFALAVGFLPVLSGAWQRTVRTEAYLPDLEAQAKQTPYDGPLLALLGVRLMEAGEYSAAADNLRQAVATGEQNEVVWRCLAAALAASGQRSRAIANLHIGLQAFPESKALQVSLARAQAADVALTPLALALEISPAGAEPLLDQYARGSWLNPLVAWWGKRNPEQSGFATRQEWIRQRSNEAQVQRLWGLALLRNRRFAQAVETLQRALALAPQSPEVNLALADALDQQGQPAKAALQFLSCLKLRPNWLPALLGLGRASLQAGVKQNALQSYQRATEVSPSSVEAWIGLGHSYQLTGSTYDKAVSAYETARRLAPSDITFFNDYALSLYKMSRQDEAEAILRQRLQVAPNDALSHYLLGMVLMNTNPTPSRQAEAEAQTREALRLSPGNPLASVQLAQLLLQQDKAAQAVTLLKAALQRNPYNSSALSLLPRAYRKAGQVALAERAASQADHVFHAQQRIAVLKDRAKENLLDRSIHEQLVNLYERIGAKDKAQQERDMLRLLRSDPKAVAKAEQAYNNSINQVLGNP